MRVYLDVSCLNRLFDDKRQIRVRLEADAILRVLKWAQSGELEYVASEMSEIEIDANPNTERRRRVSKLLPPTNAILALNLEIYERAEALQEGGLGGADAIHVAAAEAMNADVFLTCDDKLLRACRRLGSKVGVDVRNPLEWLEERH